MLIESKYTMSFRVISDFIILLLYVADMLIVGKDISRINDLKNTLSESFAMKDLGEARKILSIEIVQD